MLAGTVFNQLVRTLDGNSTLSDYVEQVYKGVRYNIEPDSMPCIMCEVRGNNELERDMGQIKHIYLDVDIIAYVSSPSDPDYAIVGQKDMFYYGVLDIENDIRACLQSSYTLGNTVIDIKFLPTEFMDFEHKNTLMRGVRIPVRLLYRQTDGA